MDHQQVYYFITLFAVGCSSKPLAATQQDPWTLDSPMLQHGVPLNFANMTVVGMKETLTWTWASSKGDSWEVVVHFSADGKLKGSWEYKQSRGDRRPLRLLWERVNKKTKWIQFPAPEAKPPPWKLNLRDIIELHFKPRNGSWEFQVGGDKIYSEKPEEESGFKNGKGLKGARGIKSAQVSVEATDYGIADTSSNDVDGEANESAGPISRNKRSPQGESGNEGGIGSWLKSMWNYFFGEGDEARGESEGIFYRFGKWIRGVSCDMGGPCDREEPGDLSRGPLPQPTMPPMQFQENEPRVPRR